MGARVLAVVAAVLAAITTWERLVLGPTGPQSVTVWLTSLIVIACVVTGRWFDLVTRCAVAAAVSWLTTICVVLFGPIDHSWGSGEGVALWILLAQSIRTLPARQAVIVGTALGTAAIVGPARYQQSGPIPTLMGVLTLSVALMFTYIRMLDTQRTIDFATTRTRERLEIARELHDLVAQHITGIMILARSGHTDPVRMSRALDEIEVAGAQSMAAMRRMVRLLRDDSAPRLDPTPDFQQLEADAEPLRHKGLLVNLEVDEPLHARLPIGAYRIVREALTNVGKHAQDATRVDVRIAQATGGGLDIEVTDDGHPFAPAALEPAESLEIGGFGLIGLRERLKELGGTFQSGPIEPHGWQIKAYLPPEDDITRLSQ